MKRFTNWLCGDGSEETKRKRTTLLYVGIAFALLTTILVATAFKSSPEISGKFFHQITIDHHLDAKSK